MGLVRYFFSPEIGRSLHEMARPVAALRAWRWGPAEERVPFRLAWKGLSAGEKLLVAAGLLLVAACGVVGAAILGFQAADAQAQGIAPSLFAAPDEKTQELLGFISNLDKARASVPTVNAMFGAFNMWMLALGMYLLIYYTVTKTVDTGARGRFAFGKWEIIRIVTAVALMAPILSGMNGLQYMVIGLGKMAGGFANAVWEPFSEAALGDGKIEVPDPSERAWRAAIAGTLVLEVCREAANRTAGDAGDADYVVVRETPGKKWGWLADENTRLVHYDGSSRKGLPEGMCGSIVYSGLEAEGPAQLAAAGHMKALEDVRVAVLRSVAAELVDHVWGQPKPEDFGKALPDVEALLTSAGAAEKYGNTLDAALELAADTEQKQLAEQVKNDARRGSWLSAAGFFNTIAYRVGRFHAGVNSVPEVSAPLPELKERWVPQAYWAWKAVTDALANSQEYPAVVASGALSGAGSVLSAGGSQRFIGAVLASIGIKDIAIQQTGNPVADLANFGHSLINRALYAMGALAGVAAGSGIFGVVSLDVFTSVWQVADGFLSTILGLMVVAGAFLAFVLPAMPFIRFLFGILTWLVTVVVALLAVTVWAAAHMAGGEGDRLVTGATRNGWLFLPGVFLRPPLMVFGLVLGYFVFLAVMERFNQVWMIHLQGTNLAHSVGVVGYLAYLMLYVIVAYALLNGALKLIDVLPSATLEWIGGRAGAAEQDSDRVGGAAAAGLFRAGGLRVSPIRRSG